VNPVGALVGGVELLGDVEKLMMSIEICRQESEEEL